MEENNNNQEQIDRMMSFLNPEGKSAITILNELNLIKKRSEREHNKLISKYRKQLLYSILGNLNHYLGDHAILFLRVPIFCKDARFESMLEYLVSSTLDVGINTQNEPYVLIGSSVCSVKTEDLIPSFGENIDDLKNLCKSISQIWRDVAKIECFQNSTSEKNTISFSFDASGFILDKSIS